MDTKGTSTQGRTRRSPLRRMAALVAITAFTIACSNRDDAAPTTTVAPETTAAPASDGPATTDGGTADTTAPPATDAPGVMFGDLPSPCGPGDATIAEGENGGDTLKLAVPTDKGAEVAPGLNAEMYDTAIAFAKWCNEQGGIGGLEIEVLDADAKLFNVPQVMETICSEAFAMVGGGLTFDDQEFPRFHECKMIDIPGFTVTTPKSMSNGMVAPVPNPSDIRSGFWYQWAKENHPDAIARTANVYGDVLTTQIVAQQYEEVMNQVGGFEIVERIAYNPLGEANWAPIAQKLKDSDTQFLSFVGVPETLAQLLRSLDEIGHRPELVMVDGGFYAQVLIERAGASAEGVVVRGGFRPFEEADQSAAVTDYISMMNTYNPDGKIAALGMQTASAYLLFSTAAAACIAANDGVLDRECVLEKASEVRDWSAGGLHAVTHPGGTEPSTCTLLLQVRDGAWTRLFPELGGPDDDGNGFACREDSLFPLTGDYGDPTAGVDPNR